MRGRSRAERVAPIGFVLIVLALVAAGVGAVGHAALGRSSANAATAPGKARVYYIAADEVRWNFVPTGKNMIKGRPLGPDEATWTKRGPDRIGHVYLKALYREYTDATFTHLKPRGPRWKHLGLLGPVIHAEVGDTIKVVFRNNLSFPASIHPHGVFYGKAAEGAPYADGTGGRGKADDAVKPGHTFVYRWRVPPRAGPGPMDGSSVMWMYHSHTDEVRDTNSGLIGPIIVTRKGMARPDGSPKDVDREFVVLFSIIDENESWLLPENIERYTALKPPRHTAEEAEELEGDDEFVESNLKHSINGYLFGNVPGLVMHRGERVRWYVMDLGNEADLHSPHWHGNTVLMNGMRTDMLELLPGMMMVADMRPDDLGTWLFHCHVNDHIRAGMLALYKVVK
jgi:hephaestin